MPAAKPADLAGDLVRRRILQRDEADRLLAELAAPGAAAQGRPSAAPAAKPAAPRRPAPRRARPPARAPIAAAAEWSASLAAATRLLSGCALVGGGLLILLGALSIAWSVPLTAAALERYFGGPLTLEGAGPSLPEWLKWAELTGGGALWTTGLGLRGQQPWARWSATGLGAVAALLAAFGPALLQALGLALAVCIGWTLWSPAGASFYRERALLRNRSETS